MRAKRPLMPRFLSVCQTFFSVLCSYWCQFFLTDIGWFSHFLPLEYSLEVLRLSQSFLWNTCSSLLAPERIWGRKASLVGEILLWFLPFQVKFEAPLVYSTLFLKNFDFPWDTLMPTCKSFAKTQSTSLTWSSFVFEKIITSSTYS